MMGFVFIAGSAGSKDRAYERSALHLCWNQAAHQLQGLGELPEVERDRGGAPHPRGLALFVDDRILMVEAAERLREAKSVLGDDRQLQRAHGLLHDFVEPRRLE